MSKELKDVDGINLPMTKKFVMFEKKANTLVDNLYGLTYDEILIVDPETPITREEYEKN